MARNNIIYWISTGLLAAQVALAGVMYFTAPQVAQGFSHLGFPDFFRQELGIAKLLAAVAILLPMTPPRAREWTYAGLAITFLSATIAHSVVDGPAHALAPVIALVLLVVSYSYWHKRADQVVPARAH